MANPRQRRKSRSGTAKVTSSKQSRKNKHKVVVKGPEVLVENWDRSKTVRQNYAKLGLLPKLNPRQAGGIEPVEPLPYALRAATAATMADLEALSDAESEEDDEEEEEEEDTPMASTSAAVNADGSATLAKGLGRIIRDEHGKVIKIVLGGDDGQEVEEEVKERVERDSDEEDDDDESDDEEGGDEPKPWGEPMKDWGNENVEFEEEEVLGPRTIGQGIPIFGGVRRSVEAKTDVVRELEHLAATQRKVIRHTSEFEGDWLLSLVAKYGEDLDKMARDRKANVWQKTSGEIKRMIIKAGGFAKLKAKAEKMEASA